MFDLGWTELVVIAVIAIIVIGPKDLPVVLRTVGAWVRRGRALMREFQNGVDEILRDSEVETLRREIDAARDITPVERPEETAEPPAPPQPLPKPAPPEDAPSEDKPEKPES